MCRLKIQTLPLFTHDSAIWAKRMGDRQLISAPSDISLRQRSCSSRIHFGDGLTRKNKSALAVGWKLSGALAGRHSSPSRRGSTWLGLASRTLAVLEQLDFAHCNRLAPSTKWKLLVFYKVLLQTDTRSLVPHSTD